MTRDPLDRACDILSRLGYEETAAELRDQVRELQSQVVQMQVDAVYAAVDRVAHRRAG